MLTDEEEELIIIALEMYSALAWPCGTEEILMMIKTNWDSLGKKTVFKDHENLARTGWSHLNNAGKIGFIQENLKSSQKLEILNSNGFLADADEADYIFHANESGFSTDPNQRKMFFKKSSKDRYLLTPTSGKAMLYTVLVCGSGSGLFMSPLVVFKGLGPVWVLA